MDLLSVNSGESGDSCDSGESGESGHSGHSDEPGDSECLILLVNLMILVLSSNPIQDGSGHLNVENPFVWFQSE